MVEQLHKHVLAKGRLPKLSLEDQILLCLGYWEQSKNQSFCNPHIFKK
jgi:hypothetical protein